MLNVEVPGWVTAVTAIATTIAAIFAAFAAWRSADSARAAQEEGRASERRLLRRQLNVNAEEVRVETDRIEERASRLKLAHRGLAIFLGASGGSREKLYLEAIDEKIAKSEELAATTAEVAAKPIENATLDEISSREAQVGATLATVRALREEIEGKLTAAEAEIVQHRQSRIGQQRRRWTMLVVGIGLLVFAGDVSAQTATAFKTGERTTGMTKQCFYKAFGNAYTRTVGSVELCPPSIRVRQ